VISSCTLKSEPADEILQGEEAVEDLTEPLQIMLIGNKEV
jgi:hypothetical protein